jgi:hypothetical protein
MKALQFVGAALLAICVCQISAGEERSAQQWQKLIDKEQPVAYDPIAGSIVSALSGLDGTSVGYQVHMIYDPQFPQYKNLTIKFVRDHKEFLVLKRDLWSVVWVNDGTKNVLYCADFEGGVTGCAVVAYDLRTGKSLWRTELEGVGRPPHSKYHNAINIELIDGAVRVRGYESAGNYIEILDAKTGKTLAHRVFKPRS